MNSLISRALSTVAVLATALPLVADQAKVESLKKELAAVKTLELPARAASIVAAAKPEQRSEVAADTVRASLAVNASAAPLLVGSISRSTPEAAASSALAAYHVQPKQLAQITRAAVGGAPAQTESIVATLGKARPTAYQAIGLAAFDVAPKSADAILSGLGSASPALKALIARAQTDLTKAKIAPTVPAVLKRIETLVVAFSKASNKSTEALVAGDFTADMSKQLTTLAVTGPTVGGPYTPYDPSVGEINVANTFEAPAGGRIYSGP